jgi:hypothetical protein
MTVNISDRTGVNHVLQKASDGRIDVWASQINSIGSTGTPGDYGPLHKLDEEILRHVKVEDIDVSLIDSKLYGKYILVDENTGKRYGKAEVDLSKLLCA